MVEPKNPRNWYKIYRKLRAEGQQQVDKDAEALKLAMEGIKSERAKHTSQVVDPSTVPRLPRMSGMRVEGGRSKSGPSNIVNTAVLSFASGSKTKTLTGKGVLDKARREARELSLFSARKSLLTTPTHKLISKATQISHVPQGLLEQHRRPPAPNYVHPGLKLTTIFAPRKRTATGESGTPGGVTTEQREKRLRAFTAPVSEKQDFAVSAPISSQQQDISTTSQPSQNGDQVQPRSSYLGTVPKLSSTGNRGIRPVKTKAPVDPFMPVKRRKVV